MGKSKSKTSITKELNQLTVNRSSINVVNEQMNDLSVDVTIDMAKMCSNSAVLTQLLEFEGATVGGDFVLKDVELVAEMNVSFECLQSGEVRNEMGNSMAKTLMESIQTSVDSEVLAQLETDASAAASTGLAATGSSTSKTDVKETINITSITENNKNFENIMHNAISNNFSNSEVQNCISSVNLQQGLKANGLRVGGDVLIDGFKMNAVVDAYSKCIQDTQAASKIVNQIAEEIGIEIVEEASSKSSVESTTTASSSAVVSGLDSIMNPTSLASCSIVCIIVVGGVGAKYLGLF